MADRQMRGALDPVDNDSPLELWHDNGDGSFSRTGWVGATITATIGSLQIPDGQDVAEGITTAAAVTGDTAGSLSAKLRGLNKVAGNLADAAWTSGSGSLVALLKAVAGLLAHGQGTMANSLPVAIASDQGALSVTPTVNGGTPTITTVSVLTSSTQLLAANASRKFVAISNVGANNVYVNLAGGTAIATNLLLPANAMPLRLDAYVPLGAITAIASTGATNVSVSEG